MKGLIRKILKESEDDFGWVDEIVNTEPIMISRQQSYIINYCGTPASPDKIRWKFNSLYGADTISSGIDTMLINIFNNENITRNVEDGDGFIVYVNPFRNGISTGWDMCHHLPNVDSEYKILTPNEFLNVMFTNR